MNKEKIAHFEQVLKEEKDKRTDDLLEDKLGMDSSIKDSTSELSSYDNHPGDLGTETYEAEKNLAFRLSNKTVLGEINDALNKIKDGSYGTCEACKAQIDEDRLEILPYTRFCISCEKMFEELPKGEEEGRPIEEQILFPAFGRSNLDNSLDGQTGFDGEDTWQQLNTFNATNSYNPELPEDDLGTVEKVELISNQQYKNQIP